MKAIRKDLNVEIDVRKMSPDEMPNDGITYYCDDERGTIYQEKELSVSLDETEK